MTRAANAGELTKLRSDGQWARWKMIIDRPDTVYTARATGAVNQTTWSIGFDGGSGTLGNCLADMTLLVGSTSGGWERGIARLRKAPIAGTFYIGADASISCFDDDYLTVVNDFAPFAKHPVGELIDVDVAYTDQMDVADFIPVPVFNERIAVINAGDTIGFDGSDSWCAGTATVSSYAWTFTGASSSTGTATATPTATYNTSGRYRVKLVVTSDAAKTGTGYGWVYVLGDNLTYETGVYFDRVSSSVEQGWSCDVSALDRPTIKDRARVVIYADDYYSNTAGSIGPISGRENIVMVGWIIGETIERKPGYDQVTFTVGGPGDLLETITTLPAGLTDTAFPEDGATTLTAWAKVATLYHRKGLHYLINYRSTLATCIDVEVESWVWPCHKLTGDDDNLWAQLVTFAKHGMMICTPDRYAHLYIERDAAIYPVVDRTADIPVIMTMGDNDWADELTVVRRHLGDAGMVEVEGTIFIGGMIFPLGGRSPGEQPGPHGGVENISEVNFPDSATALELAGMMAANKNAEYEQIGVYHPANNRFIDVAPRQYVDLVVDSTTLRCIPRRVLQRRGDQGQIVTEIELEPEGGQWPAVNITYPGEGDPPITPPTEPPVTPPPTPTDPPEDPPEPSDADAVVVTSDDVRITSDLDQASPTWTSIISGGPTTPIDSDLPETTNDTLYVIEADSIWKCTGVTGTPAWSEVWTGSELTGGTIDTLCRVRVAPGTENLVFVTGAGTNTESGNLQPFVLRSSNGGETWSVSWIDEEIATGTFTVLSSVDDGGGNGSAVYSGTDLVTAALTFINIAFPQVCYYAVVQFDPPIPDVNPVTIEFDATGDLPSVGYDGDADLWPYINYEALSPWVSLSAAAISGGYHISGTMNGTLVDSKNGAQDLLHIGYFSAREARWIPSTPVTRTAYYSNFVIQGVRYATGPKAVIDVSRTNNNYVYVGTFEKVWKSTDGGFTWAESLDAGSNDLVVDPQLAGVYYQWSSTGNLELVIADTVSGSALDTETPTLVSLRLARDLNSGRLWALKSGTSLRVRYLAAWSDLDTGLTGGCGLHAYLGGKLIYLDNSAIYYSDDYGATQADKTGGWGTYGSPINAHLMSTTP